VRFTDPDGLIARTPEWYNDPNAFMGLDSESNSSSYSANYSSYKIQVPEANYSIITSSSNKSHLSILDAEIEKLEKNMFNEESSFTGESIILAGPYYANKKINLDKVLEKVDPDFEKTKENAEIIRRLSNEIVISIAINVFIPGIGKRWKASKKPSIKWDQNSQRWRDTVTGQYTKGPNMPKGFGKPSTWKEGTKDVTNEMISTKKGKEVNEKMRNSSIQDDFAGAFEQALKDMLKKKK
jgi:hypothetical protein